MLNNDLELLVCALVLINANNFVLNLLYTIVYLKY